jgi:hypothetical protein
VPGSRTFEFSFSAPRSMRGVAPRHWPRLKAHHEADRTHPAGATPWCDVRAGSDAEADTARIAEGFVAPPGWRWQHVAAAWLHAIGYAPSIGHTRFRPLDGARHRRDQGWPTSVVNLVAHHSGARFEAEERGLTTVLPVSSA